MGYTNDDFYYNNLNAEIKPNKKYLDLSYRALARAYFDHFSDGDFVVIDDKSVVGYPLMQSKDWYRETIYQDVTQFKRLKILSIDDAKLKEFPTELSQIRSLRYLMINNSKITKLPNLAKMFPKLRFLSLWGVKLQTTPDWLADFARKHHSRYYRRKIISQNFKWLKDRELYDTIIFNVGVNKDDAAVLGLLEILLGEFLYNDQVIDYFDNYYIHPILEGNTTYTTQTIDDIPTIMGTVPWDYNRRLCRPRFTLNKEGYVIGLDVAILPHEGGEKLLPYFPKEIGNLQHLQVLRLGFQYPQIYPDPDSEYHYNDLDKDPVTARIPNSIRKLKDLRYFWTNATYSESLKPFLNSLEEFSYLNQPG